MRIALPFFAAALLVAVAMPAQAAPTPEQQQEISDCGVMAQAVQLFAEARDKGLSKMDAFSSVTQGRAAYKPGSRVDETLQWAYAHPDEKPEAAAAHFSGRCTLNALDILNPLSEDELRLAVAACQKEQPDGIKPCIIDKTSSIIVASNTPPAPPPPTELEAPAAATVAAAPAATVAVPTANVAAVAKPPAPIVLPPTEVAVPAPEAAPAPVVQGTGRVAAAPAPSVALSAMVVKAPPAPAPVVVAQAPVAVTPPPAAAPVPQPVPERAAPAIAVAAAPVPTPAPVVAAAPEPAPVIPVTAPAPVAVRAAPAPVTAVAVAAPARPAPVTAVVAQAPAVSPSSATLAGTRPPSFDTILKVSLGMAIRDARKSFGTSVQDVETDADGDTDYTYMISDDHGFVDVFTHPEDPDQVVGVSINGGADVEMEPVLGIRLGDGAFELLTRIGPPDRKVAVPGTERTRWIYGDRNYAFDVSNGGDIIGIRIYGNLGLPETAAENTPHG